MESKNQSMVQKTEKRSIGQDSTLKKLLRVYELYIPLLTLLEQFSPGADGMQVNRKLQQMKQFETMVSSICSDQEQMEQAFAAFRAAVLLNQVTARKLAAVEASFTRQQRQQLLRRVLPNVVMQGSLFSKARVCNGSKVPVQASLLLQYLRALQHFGEVGFGSREKRPENDDCKIDTSDIAAKLSKSFSHISLNNNEAAKVKLERIMRRRWRMLSK